MNWKDLQGSGRALIEVLTRHLPVEPSKTTKNVRIACDPAEI
jgi:hypothetical protein